MKTSPALTDKVAICHSPSQSVKAQQLAEDLGLPLVKPNSSLHPFLLHLTDARLELIICNSQLTPICVDFLSGKNYHRYRFGGGKGQLIAKACGLKSLSRPTVVDLTGGLGHDAFALACLECQVTIIERHPIIAALLADGLERAQTSSWFANLHLKLVHADAISYLTNNNLSQPQVFYIDPMYPERLKSSLVKKEMRVLRQLVGSDPDSNQLLPLALQRAPKRVVVKRPLPAPPLNDIEPNLRYCGRSSRFDVYLPQTHA